MEGVGGRLGRSSSRYGGAATVFSGPVRKWKKQWIIQQSSSSSTNNNKINHGGSSNSHHHHNSNNGTITNNGHGGSHLLFYKWSPLPQSNNNDGDPAAAAVTPDDDQPPLKRKFKFFPVALLEEQWMESAEKGEEETKPDDSDLNSAEPTPGSSEFNEKPDINNVPMEETEEDEAPEDKIVRQDLNESTLNLSLGLTARDSYHDLKSKADKNKDGQM